MDEHQSSAPAHPSTAEKLPKPDDMIEAHYASLERLEDDLLHADLGVEERQELRDRVLRLRRRLSRLAEVRGWRPTRRYALRSPH